MYLIALYYLFLPKLYKYIDKLRTLEYHWGIKSSLDLDPLMSDYRYKHHLARLMTIYSNYKSRIDSSKPRTLPPASPLTQLYGINGNNYEFS